MAQLSLYIDDSTSERLSTIAKARNCSVSKYVASLISEKLLEEEADEAKKKLILQGLRGSLDERMTL